MRAQGLMRAAGWTTGGGRCLFTVFASLALAFAPMKASAQQNANAPRSAAGAKTVESNSAAGKAGPAPLFPGAGSKDPINIEADRLEYFNKEQKAIYIGNVVAVQGETTLKCAKLTIFLDRQQTSPGGTKPTAGQDGPQGPSSGQVSRMEAEGPVSFLSKDQAGSGDRAEFDKKQNKVFLYGHVVLSQGTNITKGDKLIYDLSTGEAVIDSDNPSGRVSGFFVPNSSDGESKKQESSKPDDKKSAAGKPPVKPAKPKAKKASDAG